MKFLTYEAAGFEQAGIVNKDGMVFPFADLLEDAPGTLLEFIEKCSGLERDLPDFEAIIIEKGLKGIPVSTVTLKAPIPYPHREIICLGKNYADHAKEVKATALDPKGGSLVPVIPVYFGKSAYPAIGSGQPIPSHADITSQVDYEVELVVVIGKECDHVTPEEVPDYIFGYTIMNDVSARDLQVAHSQWYFGKSLDGFCPMGPVIVDKSEIPFPVELNLCSRVNGELRQNANTKLFIFDIPFVISQLSQGMKLYPGDMLATGTPAGVGHGFDPVRNLRSGDIVECEIERIGILRNVIK